MLLYLTTSAGGKIIMEASSGARQWEISKMRNFASCRGIAKLTPPSSRNNFWNIFHPFLLSRGRRDAHDEAF